MKSCDDFQAGQKCDVSDVTNLLAFKMISTRLGIAWHRWDSSALPEWETDTISYYLLCILRNDVTKQ
jgi:hypothetical protein